MYFGISGLSFPMSERATPVESQVELGSRVRGPRNANRKFIRGILRSWDLATPFIPLSTLNAFRNVLLGKGHVFHFTGNTHAYSGLRNDPSTSDHATLKIGAGLNEDALRLFADTQVNFPAGLGNSWSIWIRVDDGVGGWDVYGETSDGTQVINGLVTTFTNDWFSVNSGTVEITTPSGVEVFVDELVILPYVIPNSFLTGWTDTTTPFSPLPFLNISGDIGTFEATATPIEIEHSSKEGYGRLQFSLSSEVSE